MPKIQRQSEQTQMVASHRNQGIEPLHWRIGTKTRPTPVTICQSEKVMFKVSKGITDTHSLIESFLFLIDSIKHLGDILQRLTLGLLQACLHEDAVADVEATKDEESASRAPCKHWLGDETHKQVKEESTECGNCQRVLALSHHEEFCRVEPWNDSPRGLKAE